MGIGSNCEEPSGYILAEVSFVVQYNKGLFLQDSHTMNETCEYFWRNVPFWDQGLKVGFSRELIVLMNFQRLIWRLEVRKTLQRWSWSCSSVLQKPHAIWSCRALLQGVDYALAIGLSDRLRASSLSPAAPDSDQAYEYRIVFHLRSYHNWSNKYPALDIRCQSSGGRLWSHADFCGAADF